MVFGLGWMLLFWGLVFFGCFALLVYAGCSVLVWFGFACCFDWWCYYPCVVLITWYCWCDWLIVKLILVYVWLLLCLSLLVIRFAASLVCLGLMVFFVVSWLFSFHCLRFSFCFCDSWCGERSGEICVYYDWLFFSFWWIITLNYWLRVGVLV